MSDVSVPVQSVPVGSPSPLVNLGGMIGIAASFLGLAIFLAGCFGIGRAFELAFLPLIGSVVGLVMTVVGGVVRRGGVERTGVVAGLFVNVFALVGGLLEFAMVHGSALFPTGTSGGQ